MVGVKLRLKTLALVTLGAAGWFACSSNEQAVPLEGSADGPVASTRQSLLPQGWTPAQLTTSPSAWYVASAADVGVTSGTSGPITTWTEHRNNGRNLTGLGSPQFDPHGWPGNQPTVTLNGGNLFVLGTQNTWPVNWTDSPAGTDSAFTILAVVQSTSTTPSETAAIAGWWDLNGASDVWLSLKQQDGHTLLEGVRKYSLGMAQEFETQHDLGTGPSAPPHVVAWRYSPSGQTFTLVVDGTPTTSRALQPILPLSAMPFIIGAGSLLPTYLFKGNISELVVVPHDVPDADIENFTEYARIQWLNLPTQGSNDPCLDVNGAAVSSLTVRCDDNDSGTYGDHCSGSTCVGTAPSAGSPAELTPLAWYHANPQEVITRENGVETWFDRGTHHLDLSDGFSFGRPALTADGWSPGKSTVTFSGHNTLSRHGWTDTPGGNDGEFTFLAVVQPKVAQTAGIAGWWSSDGHGRIGCDFKVNGSATGLDLFRYDWMNGNQDFSSTSDVGTAKHVVAFRYAAENIQLDVDDASVPSGALTQLLALAPDEMLVGADNDFAQAFLNAEVAELALIPRAISNAELKSFRRYAYNEWGGLPQVPQGTVGDTCALTADCSGGLACVAGVCACSCDGQACGAEDGCGHTCECGPGTSGCTDDSGCVAGLICINGTCGPTGCESDPIGTGCGFAGAPCGSCTPNPRCNSDADCPPGLVCPEDDGDNFDLPGERVCEPQICTTDPQSGGCGAPTDPCGKCPSCLQACASVRCGDGNTSDGCGGECTGMCQEGDPTGCQADSDCQAGDVCLQADLGCTAGECVHVCRPADPCTHADIPQDDCGFPSATCGSTCPSDIFPTGFCLDRTCGPDSSGGSCGSCGAGQYCTAGGHCGALASDPPIKVPTALGGPPTRVVTPLASPTAVPVGTIAGRFEVTDHGTASYTMPLELPPGVMGLVPTLALRYTSSAGNGPLGVGWTLDGLSAITACPKSYAHDGIAAAPDVTRRDAWCLDGQHLVQINTGDPPEYRTDVDVFSQIKGVMNGGAVDSFEVRTKDGRILTYGGSSTTAELRSANVTTYALSTVKDRSGNFIRFTYQQFESTTLSNPLAADLLPLSITYTGNGSLDGDREIVFHTHSRSDDAVVGWQTGGIPFQRSQLIDGIEVHAENQLVRRYELTYEVAAGQNRLHQVQEGLTSTACNAAGATCLNPTVFTYYDDTGFEDPITFAAQSTSIVPGFNWLFGVQHWAQPVGIVHRWAPGDPSGNPPHTPVLAGLNPVFERRADRISAFWGGGNVTTVSQPLPGSLGNDLALGGTLADNPLAIGAGVVVNFLNGLLSHQETQTIDYFGFTYSPLFQDQTLPSDVAEPVVPNRAVIVGPTGGESILDLPSTVFPTDPNSRPTWFIDLDGDGVQDKLFCYGGDGGGPFGLPAPTPGELDYEASNARNVASNAFPAPPINARHGDGQAVQVPSTFASMCTCTLVNCTGAASFGMDVDGDGVANFVAYDKDTKRWNVLFITSAGPHWDVDRLDVLDGTVDPEQHLVLPLDVNGDGLSDIVALPKLQTVKVANIVTITEPLRPGYIALNTGHGFSLRELSAADNASLEAPLLSPFIVDLNHDGKFELLERDSADASDVNSSKQWYLRSFQDSTIVRTPVTTATMGNLTSAYGATGDFDGDGNLDLLTLGADTAHQILYRGKGRQNHLLKTVIDGVGKQIDVRYDELDGSGAPVFDSGLASFNAQTPADSSCRWPYRCSEVVPVALVSSTVESHYFDLARHLQTTDRTSRFHYKGSRDDVAGYGWLGVWERTISVDDGLGGRLKDVDVTYEPPPAWQNDLSTIPYVHVTTGLVHQTTVEDAAAISAISGIAEGFETVDQNQWLVRTSSAGRPFPLLRSVTRTVSEVEDAIDTNEMPVYLKYTSYDTDAYGNLVNLHHFETDLAADGSAGLSTSYDSTRTFSPTQDELAAWLISSMKTDTVSAEPRCVSDECVKEARHRFTSYDYYSDTGLLRHIYRQLDDPSAALTTEFKRDDPYGNVTAVVKSNDQYTRTTQTTFDSLGLFPLTTTQVGSGPLQQSQSRYDTRFGKVAVEADPNGIDSTWSYDQLGVERVHTGPNGTERTDYVVTDGNSLQNPAGSRISHHGVRGVNANTDEYYDVFGHLVQRVTLGIEGTPVHEEFVYDQRGRLVSQTRPHVNNDATQGAYAFAYDDRDRVTLETRPDGGRVTHDYGFNRFVALNHQSWQVSSAVEAQVTTELTDADDPPISMTTLTDPDSKPVRIIDAVDGDTDYLYGAFGDVRSITDPAGRTVDIVHDDWGRQVSVTDQARGGTETTDYDGFDEPVHTSDPALRTSDIHYDDYGRVSQVFNDSTTPSQWFYDDDDGTAAPNAIGRVTRTETPDGESITYGYEPITATRNRGFLTDVTRHVIKPTDASVTRDLATDYVYDDYGNVQRITYPNAFGARAGAFYLDDTYGHIRQVEDAANQNFCYWRRAADEQGVRVRQARIGTLCNDNSGGTLTTYGYNQATGQLEGVQTTGPTGATIQNLSYEHDLAGRVHRRVDEVSARSETYGYDGLSRLTHVNGVEKYVYDPSGAGRLAALTGADNNNRVYAYRSDEGRDWIESAGPWSYPNPDPVGNVATRDGPNNVNQSFIYTPFDLPSSITSNTDTTRFRYDPDHQRSAKQDSEGTTFYAGREHQEIQETGGAQYARTMIYVGNQPIAQITRDSSGNSATRYLFEDGVGTIQATMLANGSVEGRREYTPFGEPIGTNTGLSQVPYGFTGQEEDTALGLVNMNRRIYDPTLGQFLEADPYLGRTVSQGLNRFAFGENSPPNFVDPTGMLSWNDVDKLAEGALYGLAGAKLGAMFGVSWFGATNNAVIAGVNGALAGYRQVYSLDNNGLASFFLDSTWGIMGTAEGDWLNVYNTFVLPIGGMHPGFRESLSRRNNVQIFGNGFKLGDFTTTLGNVTTHARGDDASELAHEREHVWTNRIFGPIYAVSSVDWYVATIAGPVLVLGPASILPIGVSYVTHPHQILAHSYDSDPWEAHAYCNHNPDAWDTRDAVTWWCGSAP